MTDASITFRKTMTTAEQALYTGISGNLHPLYVNDIHAHSVSGGGMIVFELAIASLATTAFAEIGGSGRRLASLSLEFPSPARIGDTVKATVESAGETEGRLTTRILCTLEDGTLVAQGQADLVAVAKD
ncbi:MaoC/PaaZ C-terminal domain-containing protein [Mesorhizobium sp.]|uniref:MaoC/PaaZ C-terminal domain-containing protein n=1 Tax=Mesorhizobium sp. TaxID=1871066 RepID=UPI0025E601E2|nr:MaoC/PaaZ C-terminal domain-containing protein [Mesorhizobium sp.]